MRSLRMSLVPLLIFVHLFATGCADTTRAAGDAPVHLHLVCPAGPDGQTMACESTERLAHFTAWVNDALSRPHSTFTIWAVGPTRQRTHVFFAACVPPQWGPSVWKAKAAFMAQARQGVSGSQPGLTVPERCRPPGPHASGGHQLAVSVSSALARDVWQQVATGVAAAPLHLAIVCDRSDSTDGAACHPMALLRAFDRWVSEGRMLPGASLSVEMMVGPSRHFLRAVYHLTVPDLSVGERAAFVLGGRHEVSQLLTGPPGQYTSTIAEAISATVSRLRERRGRYQLVVLSDLLQITPGVWNFEHTLPQPQDFLTWLKKSGVAADLRDIPVLACGVHTAQSAGGQSPYTASYAARLRDLWEKAFHAMGAPEVKVFSACDAAFAA